MTYFSEEGAYQEVDMPLLVYTYSFSMPDIRKKFLPTVNLCDILVNGLSLDGSKWTCFPGSKITCQPCERRLLL